MIHRSVQRFKSVPSLAAFLTLLTCLAPLAGCKGGAEPISHILASPTSYADKDVTIAGRVTRVFDPSAGLVGLAAYQVEDKTGKIWVITHGGAPSPGEEVGVKGRVRQDFSLGNELLGAVLNEEEHRTR